MYTIDNVLEEVARCRGPLARRGHVDYGQVWDVFNRYLTDVIDKRQTLSVPNFCKIGWRFDEQLPGRIRMRPHFHLADPFAKTYGVDVRAHPPVSDKMLATGEDFNFSKAAIRFSQNLTKDHVFMGLRAILQQLGEAVASGHQLSIDFEVGKLRAQDRQVQFHFAAELYLREGLEVPEEATNDVDYKPSCTFAPPSKDALSLSLQGHSAHGTLDLQEADGGRAQSTMLGGWKDDGIVVGSEQRGGFGEPQAENGDQVDLEEPESGGPHRSVHFMDVVRENGCSSGAYVQNLHEAAVDAKQSITREERAQQAALDRQIHKAHLLATQAIDDKELWENHLQRCTAEEEHVRTMRKVLQQEYGAQLREQMRDVEDRRVEGRQFIIEQASTHDFPNFAERTLPEADVYDYLCERRDNLKADLDQQVEIKQRLKQAANSRERDLEITQIKATQQEALQMRMEARTTKERNRAALNKAWKEDNQFKSVTRAIEDFHMNPGSRDALSGLVGQLPTSTTSQCVPTNAQATSSQNGARKERRSTPRNAGASAPPLSSRAAPLAPATTDIFGPGPLNCGYGIPISLVPGTPRGDSMSSPRSSRPPTGSFRRMPLGAAASLAVHKEKMGATYPRLGATRAVPQIHAAAYSR